MNHRAVVNVATGRYVKGQTRLMTACAAQGVSTVLFRDFLPKGSPSHQDVPYAFKAYALKEAERCNVWTLLWCDACILPVKMLGPLLDRIERDGYWMCRNGFKNSEWTADSAYPDLFPEYLTEDARLVNARIEHVVATAFGISLAHERGCAFLNEYYRLASETKAFCGPWTNAPLDTDSRVFTAAVHPCGPVTTHGHRHDQTAASVIAWRLGFELTSAPDIFAYAGGADERTVLVADGAY